MRKCNRLFAISVLITISVFSGSCRKDSPVLTEVSNYPGNNYSNLFDAYWTGMNNNYVWWSQDTTDWDRVYKTYKPLFSGLTSFNTNNETKAEQYFEEISSGLIDSHFRLTFSNTGQVYSPSLERKQNIDPNYLQDSIFPSYLLNILITTYYIDSLTLKQGSDNLSGGLGSYLNATSGIINNKLLYLSFTSFDISKAGINTTPVFDYFFQVVKNLPPNIKGIVIDLRGNPGGEIIDLDYVLGQMISSPLTYGYSRTKNGLNRLDYSPWAPAIVKTWNGGNNIKVPIIVLGDHGSTSLSELMAIAVRTLPNGIYIGTNTWGATGPVSQNIYYNSGSFIIGTPY